MKTSNLEYLRKWGGSTTDAILDPACQIFRTSEIDGLIGYRLENGCAIVFGDPVCPSTEIKNLIQSFHDYCKNKNLKIIYLIVSEEFAHWLIQHEYCKSMIEYGEELILDPNDDPRKKEGVQASLVRRKTRHALKEGVTVKEYLPFNDEIEKAITEVGDKWLKGRKGPQIHISHVHSFDHQEGKRWIYAEKNGELVGVLTLNRLDKHQGWLLNHLMFIPESPHGVPELLVVSALEILSQEKCKYVTFGTVPACDLGEFIGFGVFSKYLAKGIYRLVNKIYHLDGKKKFWKKFHPTSKKAFLAFQNSYVSLQELFALKKSLNASFLGNNEN